MPAIIMWPALLTNAMHLVRMMGNTSSEVAQENLRWDSHDSRCPRLGQRAFALSWSVWKILLYGREFMVGWFFLCSVKMD